MVDERQFRDQILDTMDMERERGITIKSHTISLPYTADDGQEYELNLIDTPGHVDFSYEVSRALASCEGVLLLVDASQGVEAQTVANLYLAMEHDLDIIPVINKIDLPAADIERVKEQIDRELGLDPEMRHPVLRQGGHRHRRGAGGHRRPSPAAQGEPRGSRSAALIFDANYDSFRGTVVCCRVFNGRSGPGTSSAPCTTIPPTRWRKSGVFRLNPRARKELTAGRWAISSPASRR